MKRVKEGASRTEPFPELWWLWLAVYAKRGRGEIPLEGGGATATLPIGLPPHVELCRLGLELTTRVVALLTAREKRAHSK